jgi:flagellar biosynthesis/type III secretory pathway chaperone
MTTEERITSILNEQINCYEILLELLRNERICLIELNAGRIEELYKKKDVIILKLKLLEDERIRLMKGFGEGDMTLLNLAEATGDSVFLDIRSALKSLLQAVEELNNYNRLLIDRSLSYFRSNSGFFSTFGFNEGRSQKGLLLSRET